MYKSKKSVWRISGFTIVESVVAFAVGSVGILAITELVQNFYQSQKFMKSSIELTQFDTNMRLMLSKNACRNVLGAGYRNFPTSAANANSWDPTVDIERDVVLHNTNTGTGQVFGVGSQISPDYRVSRIYIRKRTNPAGSGDMNSAIPMAYSYPETAPGLGNQQTVVRRGIIAQLIVELQNLPNTLPSPLPSPLPTFVATGPDRILKAYDITFFTETPGAGIVPFDTVANPWKIGGCSDPEAMQGTAIGHQGAPTPNGTPSGSPPGCVQVNAPSDNNWAFCPTGTYVMSQDPIPIVRIACPACMKGSVCCYGYNVMRNSVMCCPIPR